MLLPLKEYEMEGTENIVSDTKDSCQDTDI